jgi:hypothetical protein
MLEYGKDQVTLYTRCTWRLAPLASSSHTHRTCVHHRHERNIDIHSQYAYPLCNVKYLYKEISRLSGQFSIYWTSHVAQQYSGGAAVHLATIYFIPRTVDSESAKYGPSSQPGRLVLRHHPLLLLRSSGTCDQHGSEPVVFSWPSLPPRFGPSRVKQ